MMCQPLITAFIRAIPAVAAQSFCMFMSLVDASEVNEVETNTV